MIFRISFGVTARISNLWNNVVKEVKVDDRRDDKKKTCLLFKRYKDSAKRIFSLLTLKKL